MNLLLPPRDLLLFMTAAVVLLFVPGPAVLYIVARSVDQARKVGLPGVPALLLVVWFTFGLLRSGSRLYWSLPLWHTP